MTVKGGLRTLMVRARHALRLVALMCPMLVGCDMQVPEGQLVCKDAMDCPSPWLCIQSRCYSVSAAASVVQPPPPKDASTEPDTAPRTQDSATNDIDGGREPADVSGGHGGGGQRAGQGGSAGRKALLNAGRGGTGAGGHEAGHAAASGGDAGASGAAGSIGAAAKGGSDAGAPAAGHGGAGARAGVSGGVAVGKSGAGGT